MRIDDDAHIDGAAPPAIPRYDLILTEQVESDDVAGKHDGEEDADRSTSPRVRHAELAALDEEVPHTKQADGHQSAGDYGEQAADEEVRLHVRSYVRRHEPHAHPLAAAVALRLHGLELVAAELAIAAARLVQPTLQTGQMDVGQRALAAARRYETLARRIRVTDATTYARQ